MIVAHRCGWVPPRQGKGRHKSITWLECERAASDGKEVLAFLVDEKHPWPEKGREAYRLTEAVEKGSYSEALSKEVRRNVTLLKDFKAWLNGRGIRATFATPEDLRRCVAEGLGDWRTRHPDIGPSLHPPADPSRYLLDLLDKTAYIDIRGLSVGTGQAHRFPIEQLFIALSTTAPAGRLGESPKRRRGKRPDRKAKIDVSPHDSVLLDEALQNERLMIVGDPGSGKTTFLRRCPRAVRNRVGRRPASRTKASAGSLTGLSPS